GDGLGLRGGGRGRRRRRRGRRRGADRAAAPLPGEDAHRLLARRGGGRRRGGRRRERRRTGASRRQVASGGARLDVGGGEELIAPVALGGPGFRHVLVEHAAELVVAPRLAPPRVGLLAVGTARAEAAPSRAVL